MLNAQSQNDDRFILPTHYTYFNMILSALKKIGLDKDDIVIMALEGKSWRKEWLASYKAQRKEAREKHELINWEKEFTKLNKLHEELEESTNWHFIRVWDCAEADDIIAIGCKYFTDKEVIVVSSDADLKQLCYYPYVKFFSVCKKCQGSNGMFEVISNPLKIIADKARKGDISDNLIPSSTDTDEDYELRYFLVNLLELPDYVEDAIKEKLNALQSKELNLDRLPNFKNAREKFMKIYDKDKVLTYEYCASLQEKRKTRKAKVAKEKRKLKQKGE